MSGNFEDDNDDLIETLLSFYVYSRDENNYELNIEDVSRTL